MHRAALVLVLVTSSQLAGADADQTVPPPSRKIVAAEAACEQGDAGACRRAGDLYTDAFFSVDSDASHADRAFAMYRRSCELGDLSGCTGVAWVFLEGNTGPRDHKAAMRILEPTCRAGDTFACTLLADQISPGNGPAMDAGIEPDLARAFGLYEASCAVATNEGCGSGCNSLASYYYYGKTGSSYNMTIEKDHARAADYYDRACTAGCLNSCDSLGDMLRDGDEIPADATRAAAAYQKACDGRFSPACMALSTLYASGTGVAKNAKKAQRLFTRACKLSRDQVSGCRTE